MLRGRRCACECRVGKGSAQSASHPRRADSAHFWLRRVCVCVFSVWPVKMKSFSKVVVSSPEYCELCKNSLEG